MEYCYCSYDDVVRGQKKIRQAGKSGIILEELLLEEARYVTRSCGSRELINPRSSILRRQNLLKTVTDNVMRYSVAQETSRKVN